MRSKKRVKTELALKKKAMLDALKKKLGVVTEACQATKISRKAHYRWMNEDSEYKKAVEEVPSIVIDFAENALFKLIKAGTPSAIIFFLKTKGRERGYIEKQEVESNVKIDMDIDKFRTAVKDGVPFQ